jgi:hypothetical protein
MEQMYNVGIGLVIVLAFMAVLVGAAQTPCSEVTAMIAEAAAKRMR